MIKDNSFFYIFVVVVFIAIGYVVWAMYSMPKLGENSNSQVSIITKSLDV